MKTLALIKKLTITSTVLACVSLVTVPSLALAAAAKSSSNTTSTSDSSLTSTQQQQHLALIKQRGDAEINRRLTQLKKLGGIIANAVHLTASDQASLTAEVNTEVSGLTALEAQLNSETTLSAAITDAQNIISEYRVYALITPKVWLIKTADDQQAVEAKLSTMAGNLQTRITADQTAGKNVTSLQNALNGMNTEVSNAQSISSSVETDILPLLPSDYDSDMSVLNGYATQLQTAHSDCETAYNDAKTIVTGLESL